MGKKHPLGHKKVLILYAPIGAGHGSVAQAITEAFSVKHPEIQIKNVNVLDFAFDVFKNGLPKAYFLMSSRAPFLYRWIYKYHSHQSRHEFLNKVSDAMLRGTKFVDFINHFKPDFIISTNPLPMHLISETKENNIIDIPSANVCTDFGYHSFWYNKDANYYFVATQEIKKKLESKKVKADSIKVFGIPVKEKIRKNIDRAEIMQRLGFNKEWPVLLVIGGKMKYRNLIKIFDGIRAKINNLQFIAVAGRDDNLFNLLENSYLKKDPLTRIFGFVDNLEELMSCADLIVTKAGGVTVSECLTKSLPMVINDVIPGQEEDNVKYIKKNKVGFEIRSVKKCTKIIVDLFSDHKKIEELKNNCSKIAKPNAADDLVDFVSSKLENKI